MTGGVRQGIPVAVVAGLLLAAYAGCARHARPAQPNPYQHPDYARLSRAELLIESQRKGVMGRKRSLGDVQRVVASVGPLVAESVRQPAVQADLAALALGSRTAALLRDELQVLQEADLLLESGGETDAVSGAGAVGVAQWLAGTARRAGLVVDEGELARIAARERRLRAAIAQLRGRPASWTQRSATDGPLLTRDQWIAAHRAELRTLGQRRLVADERLDPRKAVFAQTRYLARLWRRFGSLEWALQAYHGGERGVERTLNLYAADGGTLPVSFADLYFEVSPRLRPRAFSYLYGRADDHRYYGWRVLAARNALALYREDPEAFRSRWQSLVPGYPLDRAWYPEALATPYADVAALQAAYKAGTLLPIPEDPVRQGYLVAALAPLDGANERWYRGLCPEALGALNLLAASYRHAGGRAPLRVVGATTTVAYLGGTGGKGRGASPERSMRDAAATPTGPRGSSPEGAVRGGAEAQPALTLHAAGLGVDVARPTDAWDRKVLEYALSSLGDRMRIAWLRDRSADAYHLCPNPAFAEELSAAAAPQPAR